MMVALSEWDNSNDAQFTGRVRGTALRYDLLFAVSTGPPAVELIFCGSPSCHVSLRQFSDFRQYLRARRTVLSGLPTQPNPRSLSSHETHITRPTSASSPPCCEQHTHGVWRHNTPLTLVASTPSSALETPPGEREAQGERVCVCVIERRACAMRFPFHSSVYEPSTSTLLFGLLPDLLRARARHRHWKGLGIASSGISSLGTAYTAVPNFGTVSTVSRWPKVKW